jgi:hypothetical protein
MAVLSCSYESLITSSGAVHKKSISPMRWPFIDSLLSLLSGLPAVLVRYRARMAPAWAAASATGMHYRTPDRACQTAPQCGR